MTGQLRLDDHLQRYSETAPHALAVAAAVDAIAVAAIEIADLASSGQLADASGLTTGRNSDGDVQRELEELMADSARLPTRERGLELIGWYHSHPDHPPLPSEYDRAHAWPWYSYVIVSVTDGEAKQMLSWRLTDDRLRFTPEEIAVKARTAA